MIIDTKNADQMRNPVRDFMLNDSETLLYWGKFANNLDRYFFNVVSVCWNEAARLSMLTKVCGLKLKEKT